MVTDLIITPRGASCGSRSCVMVGFFVVCSLLKIVICLCVGAAPRVVWARRRIRAVRGEGGGGDRHAAASGQSCPHTIQAYPAPLPSVSKSFIITTHISFKWFKMPMKTRNGYIFVFCDPARFYFLSVSGKVIFLRNPDCLISHDGHWEGQKYYLPILDLAVIISWMLYRTNSCLRRFWVPRCSWNLNVLGLYSARVCTFLPSLKNTVSIWRFLI